MLRLYNVTYNEVMQKIFIVEDDTSIVDSLKDILSREFSVATTLNFRAVVQEITEAHADLVLMDITLPYFNGFIGQQRYVRLVKCLLFHFKC